MKRPAFYLSLLTAAIALTAWLWPVVALPFLVMRGLELLRERARGEA